MRIAVIFNSELNKAKLSAAAAVKTARQIQWFCASLKAIVVLLLAVLRMPLWVALNTA